MQGYAFFIDFLNKCKEIADVDLESIYHIALKIFLTNLK